MMEVDRKIDNFTGRKLIAWEQKTYTSQHVDGWREQVAHLRGSCNKFGHHPGPTQYARDEEHLSQELEWLHMEERQPGSAATGGGRVGADDTTLIESVPDNCCTSWRYPDVHTEF